MAYEFEERLKEIIFSCKCGINSSDINEEIDLIKDFGFDSISIIKLIVEIENSFDIEIEDQYLLLEKLSPYKELVGIVENYLNLK